MGRLGWFAGFLFLCLALAVALGLDNLADHSRYAARVRGGQQLVRVLGLTDLSLWTEARYTRHLSQADNFAAFQEHPAALDHFPAGSLVSPPRQTATTRLTLIKKPGSP